MAEYHKYVFDEGSRSFVGQFEEMYSEELQVGFDAWHQEDPRQLNRRIALEILSSYHFRSVLDLGCGKGVITCLLKKANNYVLGIDISDTAVSIAKSRFPDIAFTKCDLNGLDNLRQHLAEDRYFRESSIDLVFSAECLSYIEDWKSLIAFSSTVSRYMMITLYIPPNPIGYVKSPEDLEQIFGEHFRIVESIWMNRSRFMILFGEQNLPTRGDFSNARI